MKLINVLKSIILEQNERVMLGEFIDKDGDEFEVTATIHSQVSTKQTTKSGRIDVETIGDVIIEFSDIFSEVSKSILNDPKKTTILVRDYLNRFDFIVAPHKNRSGNYSLNIVTSIPYPKKLSYKPENRLIIIKNDGDLIVEEFINLNSLTKQIKGDIIIYYEK
jgi:hypothetical protein